MTEFQASVILILSICISAYLTFPRNWMNFCGEVFLASIYEGHSISHLVRCKRQQSKFCIVSYFLT